MKAKFLQELKINTNENPRKSLSFQQVYSFYDFNIQVALSYNKVNTKLNKHIN